MSGPLNDRFYSWSPLITMLQLAVDMLTCNDVTKGFGHVFAAEHYIDAWVALTDPQDWKIEDTDNNNSIPKRKVKHVKQ